MSNTIDYYNQNADDFYESTINADMSKQYSVFEKYLHEGDSILDLGCGSGRDSKYFLDKGYKVTAIDGSIELCRKASALTGLEVRNILFNDIDYIGQFDGIWACASLLHVPADELGALMKKLTRAVKKNGIMYASFKYGDFSGERNGRFFTDMTQERVANIINGVTGLSIIESYISTDVRKDQGREEEHWVNIILQW